MTRSLRPLIIIEVILIATAVFLSALIVFVVLSKHGSSAEDAIDLVHASTSPTIPAASPDITTPTRMTILVPSPTATATRPALPPPLSLAEIFPPRNLLPFSLEPQHLRTVIATGDISPARSTDALIRKHNDDFAYIVSETKDVLASGDLTVINLEAPLIKDCPFHTSGLKLCGRPGFVDALTSAGVDVVTLENNHIGNYGDPGLTETKLSLESAKLTWVDRNSPATVDVRGIKFGVLAVNGIGEMIDRTELVAQIHKLRSQVDLLILAIHWGAEYVALPGSAPGIAPDNPVELGHLAVDAGVDLVLGNHPHWVQAAEIYRGKLIAYAQGNFVFDQMWSNDTRIGVVGRYTFYDRTLVGVEYQPVLIEEYGKPVLLQGKEADLVLSNMKAVSEQLEQKLKAGK